MIIRIVKMNFRDEGIEPFRQLFAERKATIRNFPGCSHLELWQDSQSPNIFFTYSKWNNANDLDHYRFSEFFKDTWGRTKELFAGKAEAWSLNEVTGS